MKLRFIVPHHLRKTITEGLFSSVLAYCLPLFGGMGLGHLKELQIMQNKAARIVTSKANGEPEYLASVLKEGKD